MAKIDKQSSKNDEIIKPGYYKHFKGDTYQVLGTAMHSETLEEYVLYMHKCDTNPTGYWIRPKEMFTGYKELEDGTKVKRFVYVGSEKR